MQRLLYIFSLLVIAVCLPFIMWAVCGILPTFDDYTSLQSPWWVQIADPGYFFPDALRRPFDALLGAIVGWQPALFPTLNHILIILGHSVSAYLVYAICQRLKLDTMATNIATLFFFFSPATLGATLACDGFNQTFAQLWGLLALWFYLHKVNGQRSMVNGQRSMVNGQRSMVNGQRSMVNVHSIWLPCIVMAVLSKENGLAWAVVPPIIAYAFSLTDRRQTISDIGKGLLIAAVYFGTFATLTLTGVLEYSEEYTEATLLSHGKDFLQLMAYTWVPLDYMSAVYPPTRNWTIVIITLLLSLPFLIMLTIKSVGAGPAPARKGHSARRTLPLLILCFLILVSPHLFTVVSIMHNYAALSIAALIVAHILSSSLKIVNRKFVNRKSALAFALFLAAAIFTDIHHYTAARDSGLLGKRLATQAIKGTPYPSPLTSHLSKVMVISIDDPEEPRYSSFCVRPVDAFAWGLSVRHYTGYIRDITISEASLPAYDQQQVEVMADSALSIGNDAVWLVGHNPDSLTIFTPHNSRYLPIAPINSR